MSDQETTRDEETSPPVKKSDHKTLLIVIAFGVALVLLIALNMK
jgi:hypothetical protein